MFDVSSSEFLLVMVIALIVIGPKDLPKVLRFVGNWVSKARAVAAQFRSGIDDIVRQSELEELEKKWKAENDRIMAQTDEAVSVEQANKPAIETNDADVNAAADPAQSGKAA
jgi:sec-independent protein translocase protein TatB